MYDPDTWTIDETEWEDDQRLYYHPTWRGVTTFRREAVAHYMTNGMPDRAVCGVRVRAVTARPIDARPCSECHRLTH